MTVIARRMANLLALGIILIFAVFVEGQEVYESPELGQLVPTIKQQNYELLPNGNRYQLRLDLPDGSRRAENVELLTDGTGNKVLTVKGELNLVYQGNPYQVTIVYGADEKGYRAKYIYTSIPIAAPIPVAALSANLLKSAAG